MTLRLMTLDDADMLLSMFSTMLDAALQWGMPPYTKETVDRWMSNIGRLIALVAVFEERIVGYVAAVEKLDNPRHSVGGA